MSDFVGAALRVTIALPSMNRRRIEDFIAGHPDMVATATIVAEASDERWRVEFSGGRPTNHWRHDPVKISNVWPRWKGLIVWGIIALVACIGSGKLGYNGGVAAKSQIANDDDQPKPYCNLTVYDSAHAENALDIYGLLKKGLSRTSSGSP